MAGGLVKSRRQGEVSRGLQIWRLGGHFCGDHGASAPPPSLETDEENPMKQTNGECLRLYYFYFYGQAPL